PAGTYVAGHCEEQNGSRKCLPCRENEFIAYPNDFSRCFSCQTCREDQVELSPCRATSNTQCACRNGTFCSPDHPCEMCQKCRPRCPKDEVELAPCTPHSDRQCGPPTSTFSGSFNNLIVISVVVFLILLVVLLVLWKCCCCRRSPGEHRARGLAPAGARALCGCGLRGKRYLPGASGITALISSCRRWARPEREVLQHGGESLGWRREVVALFVGLGKNLVPVEGNDPVVPFSFPLSSFATKNFDIFAQDVPFKDWKRYGRALDLLENDIAQAEMNDRYSLEPFFQMLNTWQNRQGMNASVNTLLETLHQINLGGVAEDISCKLVQQGFFQYEVS
ncbi:Tumor necrosis factor receptor superfamily member 10B, partial [Chlamydotis macqueenii]